MDHARAITTTLYYDSQDRLTKRTFSDSTPTEHNCYDGKVFNLSTNTCVTPGTAIPFSVGRMTSSAVEGVGASSTTDLDPLGRALATEQQTWTGSAYNAYEFEYTYNIDGSLKTMTYPSGRELEYAYDSSGRPYSVGEDGGASYVNSVDYGVHGGIEGTQLGNLLYEQNCYNTRLQPVAKRLGDDATTTDCAWDGDDKLLLEFGFGSDSTNNGNLKQQAIKASATDSWTQYYTYDGLSRLEMASEDAAITGSTCPAGASWCRKYGYDHFGNRWVSASLDTLHMATPTSGSAIDLDTNRLTAGTYDKAGNLLSHPYVTTGSGSMTYNAHNEMTSFTKTGVSVTTDYAGGKRFRKVYNSETTIWVYDARGSLAAEYRNGSGPGLAANSPDKEYVYLAGKLVAMLEGAEVYYRTTDHLGSSRVVTDSVGTVIKRQDFFPFGETIPASASFGGRNSVTDASVATYNSSLGMSQQFTGQQRDEETGLDYFWARNMGAQLGRFMSMDPMNAGASIMIPQSWNAYAYVHNNPFRYVDPGGLQAFCTSPDTMFCAEGVAGGGPGELSADRPGTPPLFVGGGNSGGAGFPEGAITDPHDTTDPTCPAQFSDRSYCIPGDPDYARQYLSKPKGDGALNNSEICENSVNSNPCPGKQGWWRWAYGITLLVAATTTKPLSAQTCTAIRFLDCANFCA